MQSPKVANDDSNNILLMQQHIHNQSRSRKPFSLALSDYESTNLGSSRLNVITPPLNQMNTSQSSIPTPPPPTQTAASLGQAVLLSKKNLIMQQQFQDSFDDLDSVECINMSQCNVTKSTHNFMQKQQQQKQQQKPLKSSLKSSSAHFGADTPENTDLQLQQYQLSQQLSQQPVSILKRFDSSEKMYPISRPPNGVPAPGASHLCSASLNNFSQTCSLPRNRHNNRYLLNQSANNVYAHEQEPHHHQQHNATMYDEPSQHRFLQSKHFSQQPPLQPVRKRVQFANMPPLTSASSAGDLTLTGAQLNPPHHRHHHHREHRSASSKPHSYRHQHHHHRHHEHGGTSRQHRRSSSTSNFNSSTMVTRPVSTSVHKHAAGRHAGEHHRHRRQLSNHSLTIPSNQIYSDSDYCYYPNSGEFNRCSGNENHYDDYNDGFSSACDFDDYYNNTCSTCSSSSATSSSNTTTSTDSDEDDSDLDDDFGGGGAMYGSQNGKFYNSQQQQRRPIMAAAQFDQRSLNRLHLSNANKVTNFNQQQCQQRKFISYVDSLPLARTNPAPQMSMPSGKQAKSVDKGKHKKGLNKLRLKENCAVS